MIIFFWKVVINDDKFCDLRKMLFELENPCSTNFEFIKNANRFLSTYNKIISSYAKFLFF